MTDNGYGGGVLEFCVFVFCILAYIYIHTYIHWRMWCDKTSMKVVEHLVTAIYMKRKQTTADKRQRNIPSPRVNAIHAHRSLHINPAIGHTNYVSNVNTLLHHNSYINEMTRSYNASTMSNLDRYKWCSRFSFWIS